MPVQECEECEELVLLSVDIDIREEKIEKETYCPLCNNTVSTSEKTVEHKSFYESLGGIDGMKVP